MTGLWISLRLLAAVNPVDPTWIPGMYDDGDFDDIVNHIELLASTSDGWGTPTLVPDGHVRALVVAGPPNLVCASHLPLQDRSPPVF
jgi:hypothetical protein